MRNLGKKFCFLLLAFPLLLLMFSLSMAWAETGAPVRTAPESRAVPESRAQMQFSFAPLVKKVNPAVVNIYTQKVVKQRLISPLLEDPLFQQLFSGSLPHGMTRERLESSLGSGVLVRADGLVVTNNHVIAGADQIRVVLADRREFDATLITADEHSDLAILRIDAKGGFLPYLELEDSDTAEVGDIVLAIGNPFGVGQTVTNGIISAIARTAVDINDLNYFIQTDAAINPGNSGGALVSMDGKLVGINSAIYTRSGGNMGIGFAIPSNMVRGVIRAVSEGRKNVIRPWVGLEGQEVTAELAASLNMSQPTGMLVNAINAASPAKKAGLQVGDVVVAVNGRSVEDPEAFRFRIATLQVGATATLDVMRKGQKLSNLTMDLVAPPEDQPREKTLIKGNNPLSGVSIANLSPALMDEIHFRKSEHGTDKGVVVVDVAEGSAAARIGLVLGDMIVAINGDEVKSVRDVMQIVDSYKKARWQLAIRRGDQVINMVFAR